MMMKNWVLLGFWVLVFISVGYWWWRKNSNQSMKKKQKQQGEINSHGDGDGGTIPKGSSGWPFIGETLDFVSCGYTSRPVSFMDKRVPVYGKVFKSHLLGRPIIVSTDPDVNKVVLQNINGNTFVPYYPKSITELFGKSSILQMNGILQRRVHGLIGGFLKSPQLKARITKEIEKFVDLTMDTWTNNRLIYIQEETKNITFPVLVRVLMSVSPGKDMEFLRREFGEFIKGLVCLPIKLPGTRLYKSLKAKERLMKMVKELLEKKKLKKEKSKDNDDEAFVIADAADALLLDSGESNDMQRLPLDFITGNLIEMMIPGEDSVPMVMTLAVKYLSHNPLALGELTEENMELKKQKANLGEDYVWTDYMSMSFTQNVISETLRMANIINGIWRKALKDVQIKGYLIPKGWCVLASFSSVHMDGENYDNPYEFDPWRWQQNKQGRSGKCFTPFGGGHRLCPGLEFSRLEIAIFLHYLVTRFRWVIDKEDYIVNFPTVKMRRKLPITVTPLQLDMVTS